LTSAVELAGANVDDRINTGTDLDVWEYRPGEKVAADTSIGDTDREAIIRLRREQRLLRSVECRPVLLATTTQPDSLGPLQKTQHRSFAHQTDRRNLPCPTGGLHGEVSISLI
jgi:hypothetical protein